MNESPEEGISEKSFSLERFRAGLKSYARDLITDTENQSLKFKIEEDDYVPFNRFLNVHGMSFATRQSYAKRSGKLIFSNAKLGIPFFGSPFRVKNHTVYECINGPCRKKKPKALANDHDNEAGKQRRSRLPSTRKIDCKASMSVSKIEYFPEYEITGKINIHDQKAASMKRLKENLNPAYNKDEPVDIKILYYVKMSDPSSHSHPLWTSLKYQRVDKDVVQEIKRLVIHEGISDINFIKAALRSFIKTNISTNVSSQARSFFPSNRTIYNFVYKFINQAEDNGVACTSEPIKFQSVQHSPDPDEPEVIWLGEQEVTFEANATVVPIENSYSGQKTTLSEFKKNLEILQDISYLLPPIVSKSDELEEASSCLIKCQNILRSFLSANNNFFDVQSESTTSPKRKRRKRDNENET